jgi:hypothetical protein
MNGKGDCPFTATSIAIYGVLVRKSSQEKCEFLGYFRVSMRYLHARERV